MIYLIHGANVVDSRRFLIRFKGNYQNLEVFNGKNLKGDAIKNMLAQISHDLFGGKSAVLIEFFNGDWDALPKNPPEGIDLILWSDQKIDSGKSKVKNFLFNKVQRASTFKLVDALLFKNEKEAQILALQLLSSKEPIERILGILNRSFYLIYCEKENTLRSENLHSFVRDKVKEQAQMWSKTAIKKALLHLLRIDLDIKEGLKVNLALTTFISRVVSF